MKCFLIRNKPQSPSEYSRLPKTFENFRQHVYRNSHETVFTDENILINILMIENVICMSLILYVM